MWGVLAVALTVVGFGTAISAAIIGYTRSYDW